MRHTYRCPLRWADLDPLGHVNNVVYVDYLQEARVDMLRTHGPAASTGDLAEGVVVVRHEVSYLAPLAFGFEPVSIESWVTEIRAAAFTLAYEIFHERDEGRHVYVRARTVLTPYVFASERPRRLTALERETLATFLEPDEPGPRAPLASARPEVAAHAPVQVRFSDVDVYGHVNNVKYFEYLQEARIQLMADLWQGLEPISLVVGQTDVDYRVPILFRPEAYHAWSWMSRVGQRSATIESLILDGETVLARARIAIVFFDPRTERSLAPPEPYLEALRSLLTS
ncbi:MULTISPECIES: acyl-CoA thioesterase [unclassified Nocardioides]|uniref:acyl-CoA thioesterase n=1 Tax=unclassified Nocardioides TaxID=2615069 RepID=UPI0000571D1B|nr:MULTISPECIES: acyl-CoA thioesterase [unclassified Nocardioides]ABL80887.1 thioesterase superfamily protein [Nocardioides sp. JS614]